ncbi:glycosyltransferase [Alkalihalobacillus sp. BA299]|uniref:CgeB family protein n=1 Tax=Alkalihalobacillus sp. BA299 TaxID=2815938 RepID=UPI001ADD26D1|nr:glycosyltransferase [Alkalihalobacillus sp. BA299]
MKILYIPSGYKQTYLYFDDSIIKELVNLKHQVKVFTIMRGSMVTLRSILTSFKPDLILTLAGLKMPRSALTLIKQVKIPIAIWMTEDPYYTDKTLKFIHDYNYIFTIESSSVKLYKEYGHKNVYHLPLGTNPSIYAPSSSNNYKYDICLVGFPYPERIKTIQFLLENTPYSILTVGSTWHLALAKYKTTNNYEFIIGWVDPRTVATLYNQTKIVLNTHRSYQFKYNLNKKGVFNRSINNRTFEIASCGAFQLTDLKPDLTKHFIEGSEIVTFSSMDDLLKKTNYYIKHETERKEITKRARQRALKDHTFGNRLKKMLKIIETSI